MKIRDYHLTTMIGVGMIILSIQTPNEILKVLYLILGIGNSWLSLSNRRLQKEIDQLIQSEMVETDPEISRAIQDKYWDIM